MLDDRTIENHVVEYLGNERSKLGDRTDLLQGTLDLLILKVLRTQALHGWGISRRLRDISQEMLQINQGSLYPALYRLEHQGLIESEWGISDEGRRAKFYQLTAAGKKQLVAEEGQWRRFAVAIELVLTSG